MNGMDLMDAIGDIDDNILLKSEKDKKRSIYEKKWILRTVAMAATVAFAITYMGVQSGQFNLMENMVGIDSQKDNLVKFEKYQKVSECGPNAEYPDLFRTENLEEILNNTVTYEVDKDGKYPVYEYYENYDNLLMAGGKNALTEKELDERGAKYAQLADSKIVDETSDFNDFCGYLVKQYTCENGIKIEVEQSGKTTLTMPGFIEHPKFDNHKDAITASKEYTQYYYDKYEKYLGFEKPQFCVNAINATMATNEDGAYILDIVQKDNLAKTAYILPGCEDYGDQVVIDEPKLGKLYGYYPVISKEQVIENLTTGKYVEEYDWKDKIQKEDVAGIKISYAGSVLQPVYNVYIRMTEHDRQQMNEPDENTYLLLTIPAVEDEYLK